MGLRPLAICSTNTTIEVEDAGEFLGTLADSTSVVLDLLVHVLGVGLLVDAADGLGMVGGGGEGLLLLVGGWFGLRTVVALFEGFLVLGVVDDLVG